MGDFLEDLFARRITDRENIAARAAELGCDLSGGAGVIVVRARPQQPEEGDWRARVLTVAERGARAVERETLAALAEAGWSRLGTARTTPPTGGPSASSDPHPRSRRRRGRGAPPPRSCGELEANLPNYTLDRRPQPPRRRPRRPPPRRAPRRCSPPTSPRPAASAELSFEETGAYRLLLPAVSEDPTELQGFYDETVSPLVGYDEQYETELVRTLETFLDSDGNVARTAEKLFTHRHTIRYRLERVRS